MTHPLPLHLRGVGYAVAGKALLSGISLTIEAGQRLVILGANGAGKSLLLRLCHGLIDPTTGRRDWAGGPPHPNPARPGAQAMVLQRPVFLRRSVRANLDYPLALAGQPRAIRAARVEETLARFGLSPLADHPARRLSGGEQQRLAIARACLLQPGVLFLDEPTASLDPSGTRQVEDMLTAIAATGVTLVMTTHNLGQARRMADRVAFLHQGQILETALAPAFFAQPQTPQARAYLAGDLSW